MKSKILNILLLAIASAVVLGSCKKPKPNQWLLDNVTIVGHNPVIASFSIVAPQTTAVASGSTVNLDLRYWSEDPIDSINLSSTVGAGGTKQLISTTTDQKAYSSVTRTDSLRMQYQVPAGLTSGTTITLEARIANKNRLSAATPLNLKVQ